MRVAPFIAFSPHVNRLYDDGDVIQWPALRSVVYLSITGGTVLLANVTTHLIATFQCLSVNELYSILWFHIEYENRETGTAMKRK